MNKNINRIAKIAEKLSKLKIAKESPSKEEVKKFLQDNPNPKDPVVHKWAEENGYDVHDLESVFYELATDQAQSTNKMEDKISQYISKVDKNWNYITPEDLKKKIDNDQTDDLFLLDIRKPDDFQKGHIEGTINIFWLDLFKPENLEKLPKDKTIVLICYVGHTASQTMTLLRLLGYNVVTLKYGMGISPVEGIPVAGWKALDLPIS